jgi:fructokinase
MILVCGEALIDLMPVDAGGETAYLPRPGGSPYNVAIGLGRLGVPAGFFGRVSSDPFGRLLRDRLVAAGVDCSLLRSGDEPTALAIVHLSPGEEPQFAFHGEGAADCLLTLDDLPTVGALDDHVHALHFGSISLIREPGSTAFERLAQREHGRRVLSLDPNVRPNLIRDRAGYLALLEELVGLADIVKVSRADLAWLYPGAPPLDVAEAWRSRGPALVVITQGAAGAIALTASHRIESAGVLVAVRDTVGAGDAFSAGLLGSLDMRDLLTGAPLRALGRGDLRACLDFANTVAAITCTRAGAEPPNVEDVAAAFVV